MPAVGGDFETSGAVIGADDIEALMARDDIGYLAEMMNYPGALADGYDLWDVLQAACVNAQRHYHLDWGLL